MGEQPLKPVPTAEYQEREQYEAAMLAAEIGIEAPSIDLHGMTANEALHTTETYINHEFMRGTEAIRIIHGRGTGALQRTVHALLAQLQQQNLVAAYRDAAHLNQQGGVTLVALHRGK